MRSMIRTLPPLVPCSAFASVASQVRCLSSLSAASPSSKHRVLCDSGATVIGWVDGVDVDAPALEQLRLLTRLQGDIIRHPVAVMPDVHLGTGCTVGSVIPTTNAIIPSAVGVDIGCGMLAARTSLRPADLPASLEALRLAIEVRVPHGRTHNGRPTKDVGAWRARTVPDRVARVWGRHLASGFEELCKREPSIASSNNLHHLGTLGTGNHFVEVCVDEGSAALDGGTPEPRVWVMLHSGSRGVGSRIGTIYIERARRDMEGLSHRLPSGDLAYLTEGTQHFRDYVAAVEWAQSFAYWNRALMLEAALEALREAVPDRPFTTTAAAINCHHNYIERFETAEGERLWLTRKGATSAKAGELAVIPGSMGARSYIVRGRGSPHSYCSCSHGAGRRFGRGEAKRRFTLDDHAAATAGVECRKDAGVLDETPLAYKDIDAVMEAQSDLVEIVAVLKQVVCVKG